MEDNRESSDISSSAPSGRTIVTVSIVVVLVVLALGGWLAYRMNVAPVEECAYRGGIWSSESDSCIFEGNSRGGGEEQSGHVISSITLVVPESLEEVNFQNVEVGGTAKTYSAEFSQADTTVKGSVTLLQHLARVHKGSGDLIMPFAVHYGGTGMFIHFGVFGKESEQYRLMSSQMVGDRVGVDSLSLGATDDLGSYTARLLYRDRTEDEPMSALPRDQRSLEVAVLNGRIDSSFVSSRDGLLYKDMLKVSAPKLRSEIASPLTVEGEARGTWYFEASFPVILVDWDGKVLAEGYAQAESDWMTEELVPFSATLTFTLPADIPYRRATLILKKENPSGMPEHDDAFEIPVVFE